VKTIITKCTIQEKTEQIITGEDERGDLLVRGFLARGGTDCSLDVHVTDTDAKSYSKRAPAKVVSRVAREREETKVFGGMPPKTLSLHCFFLPWT
jgi:late competence protein required for DNA uptake (superfamily II DNA/RNA helicase)